MCFLHNTRHCQYWHRDTISADIVYSIQYGDLTGYVDKLPGSASTCNFSPQFLIFSRLLLGNVRKFCTLDLIWKSDPMSTGTQLVQVSFIP